MLGDTARDRRLRCRSHLLNSSCLRVDPLFAAFQDEVDGVIVALQITLGCEEKSIARLFRRVRFLSRTVLGLFPDKYTRGLRGGLVDNPATAVLKYCRIKYGGRRRVRLLHVRVECINSRLVHVKHWLSYQDLSAIPCDDGDEFFGDSPSSDPANSNKRR